MHADWLFITPTQILIAFLYQLLLLALAAGGMLWVLWPQLHRNVESESVADSENAVATVELPHRARRPYTGTIHAPQYDRAVASDERTVVIKVPR